MNKKILIIDDEELIANVFRRQLTLIGKFEVDFANTSLKGLEMLKIKKYDVLLLDIVIPTIDGIEIIENIVKDLDRYNNVKIIVLTNIASREIEDKIKKLGIAHILSKISVTPSKLIQLIDEVTTALSLGEKLRKYRIRKGMTQLELELEIDASLGSISRIENGQVNPTKETLKKIEKVLKLSKREVLDLYTN